MLIPKAYDLGSSLDNMFGFRCFSLNSFIFLGVQTFSSLKKILPPFFTFLTTNITYLLHEKGKNKQICTKKDYITRLCAH